MKISIFGAGYVGLVTGACFASLGFKVCILDIDQSKIRKLKKGQVPFYEPGLQELINNGIKNRTLSFTSSLKLCAKFSDIYFLCVGTPQSKTGKPNLSFLHGVCNNLLNYFKDLSHDQRKIIFIKSTVPPNTCSLLDGFFKQNKIKDKLIASNPEFLREGNAVNDFFNPDRVIVGSNSNFVKKTSLKLYSSIVTKNKMLFTNSQTSELIKYASNAFLATKISFINEISCLSDKLGADIRDVSLGLGLDHRIGKEFLNAGVGFGGSCFPKDLLGLRHSFLTESLQPSLINAVLEVNEKQYKYFLSKIFADYSLKSLKSKNVAIWGTAFKANTDDIRESVGHKIIRAISPKVLHIYAFDKHASENSKIALKDLQNITFLDSIKSTLKKSDFLILCTDDEYFLTLSYEDFLLLDDKSIYDGRNLLYDLFKNQSVVKYTGIGQDNIFNN